MGCPLQELISTLEQTKGRAVAIAAQLAAAVASSEELNRVRGRYRPAARRGALLFFALAGLATISCMYEHSLAAFLAVFGQALDAARPDADVGRRLRSIMGEATERAFRYACLGLFERHKLMFASHLALRIQVPLPRGLLVCLKTPFPCPCLHVKTCLPCLWFHCACAVTGHLLDLGTIRYLLLYYCTVVQYTQTPWKHSNTDTTASYFTRCVTR